MTGEAGSGLISPYNDDPSAAHVLGAVTQAGLGVDDFVYWNVYPWLRPGDANQPITAAGHDVGLRRLEPVIAALPALTTVAVLGRVAQRALQRHAAPDLARFHRVYAPHPGGRSWIQPGHAEAIHRCFGEVRRLLDLGADTDIQAIDYWPKGQD